MSCSPQSRVVFKNVDKSYDSSSSVVNDLNLEIAKGEFLTLLGPSGSGKTTTLMMLAGFERPTRGKILFDGKAINTVPTYKRDFGMVFQNYALFPHMTVAENLAFPLRMRKIGRSEIEDRVKRTLDMVKLGTYADRNPAQLSGGQAQRVALARSVVFNPRMVLMDEPLGALDRQLRGHMQQEIKRLHQELDITTLYVTHDQTEALTMSDRIAVLNEGKVQQIGSPEKMYGEPENKFVASFIGDNNCLTSTVVSNGDRGEVLVALDGFDTQVKAFSANHPQKIGQSVTLMIRPENVFISPADTPDSFSAQILETAYHGDHLRIVVGRRNQQILTVHVQHCDVPAAINVGQTIQLRWNTQDARLVDN